MKKLFKFILVCAATFGLFLFKTNVEAKTVTVSNYETRSVPVDTDYNYTSIYKGEWTRIYASKNGINHTVSFRTKVLSLFGKVDLRFLDKNGRVLWSKDNAISGNDKIQSFWAGSDVRYVEVRSRSAGANVMFWISRK